MRPVSRWLTRVGYALVLVLLLLGLRTLAASITAAHLRHAAERTLAQVQSGQPLWAWRLRRPADVVAGHAFGAARLASGSQGLRVRAASAEAFELGLPLASPADLAHWPWLRLQGQADAPVKLGLVLRPHHGAPACVAVHATDLPAGRFEVSLDLRRVRWRAADGGECTLPGVTSMLRLRPQLAKGTALALAYVALLPAAPSIAQPGPAMTVASEAQLDRLLAQRHDPASPTARIRLPPGGSAEALLRMRDATLRRWPAALVVVGNRPLEPARATTWQAIGRWQPLACVLYLAGLLALAWRAPRRPLTQWLEWVALLLGPVWLIAGLQWGVHAAWPAALAFIAALGYAAWAQWRERPLDWHLRSGWRTAWPALVPIPVAAALALAWGSGLHLPAPRAGVMYLLWALLQQWLLLTVVLRRLDRLLPSARVAALLTALAFALLHTPNGLLMQLCLLAEFWWARCFLRQRALLPIALAHAACALLIQAGMAGGVLRSLEVSARFFF